jgi:hypothetical protein
LRFLSAHYQATQEYSDEAIAVKFAQLKDMIEAAGLNHRTLM